MATSEQRPVLLSTLIPPHSKPRSLPDSPHFCLAWRNARRIHSDEIRLTAEARRPGRRRSSETSGRRSEVAISEVKLRRFDPLPLKSTNSAGAAGGGHGSVPDLHQPPSVTFQVGTRRILHVAFQIQRGRHGALGYIVLARFSSPCSSYAAPSSAIAGSKLPHLLGDDCKNRVPVAIFLVPE